MQSEETTKAKARVKYRLKHPNATPELQKMPALIRFWNKVVRQPNGCWLWTGASKSAEQGGYPMFHVSNDVSPKHAVSYAYQAIRGLTPPVRGSGKELSHICSTRSRCCNPYHVVEEDHTANMRRSIDAIRVAATNARKYAPPARIPDCHPDRKHCALGKCKRCYDVYNGRRYRARKKAEESDAA